MKVWATRKGASRGAAWLSSARVVRCWVKSRNERNPYPVLLPAREDPQETAADNVEEGGDDVKSSWPLCPGLHTCYNGANSGKQYRKVEQILKSRLSSDRGLQLAPGKVESLVIADQQLQRLIRSRALYTPPVTPRKPIATE